MFKSQWDLGQRESCFSLSGKYREENGEIEPEMIEIFTLQVSNRLRKILDQSLTLDEVDTVPISI